MRHAKAVLILLAALSGCLPIASETTSLPPEISRHNPLINPATEQARAAIAQGALVIDVRSTEEYSEDHYKNAINIPHTLITEKLGLLGRDKTQSIVVYCGSGNRAEVAKQDLKRLGFDNVINGGGLKDIKQD